MSIMTSCGIAALLPLLQSAGGDPFLSDSIISAEAQVVFENDLRRQEEDSAYNAHIRMMLDSAEYRTSVRDLDQLLNAIPTPTTELPFNPVTGPWIFSGYRPVSPHKFQEEIVMERLTVPSLPDPTPDWLRTALTRDRIADNFIYTMMINYPHTIDYAYWDLPVPPRLPEDDISFASYIKRLDLPEVVAAQEMEAAFFEGKTHWLHNAQAGVQFSQAYVSTNWYQGGNDYLALLINLLWDVQLNTVYHPNYLLQSTVSYKLGLNSVQDSHHKYSISEDLFQWNFKAGLKAFKNFFWSYNLLFKTQLLNNYESNSDNLTASFLSPGDLNMGLGMSYSYANAKRRIKVGVSLSPLSYNLKTCINDRMDPTPFNIQPGHHTHSEIGTNAEATLEWGITSDISCKSRFFAFTDYQYFQSDLETTFNFTVNRFLSTQLYVHLRYDSSSDANLSRWRHWMLKEILSFGLTYTFSTKPS